MLHMCRHFGSQNRAGIGVSGGCKLPNIGARNQTSVTWRNSKHSGLLNPLSSSPLSPVMYKYDIVHWFCIQHSSILSISDDWSVGYFRSMCTILPPVKTTVSSLPFWESFHLLFVFLILLHWPQLLLQCWRDTVRGKIIPFWGQRGRFQILPPKTASPDLSFYTEYLLLIL